MWMAPRPVAHQSLGCKEEGVRRSSGGGDRLIRRGGKSPHNSATATGCQETTKHSISKEVLWLGQRENGNKSLLLLH